MKCQVLIYLNYKNKKYHRVLSASILPSALRVEKDALTEAMLW